MELTLRSPRFLRAAGAAIGATALFAAWIGLDAGGPRATLWMDDLTTPLAAGAGCALCVSAAIRHTGRMRIFWSVLAGAMACWTAAEVAWGVYALILEREVPGVYTYYTQVANYSSASPNWIDTGWVAAYLGIGLAAYSSGTDLSQAKPARRGDVVASLNRPVLGGALAAGGAQSSYRRPSDHDRAQPRRRRALGRAGRAGGGAGSA